jgi:hypothetical protein
MYKFLQILHPGVIRTHDLMSWGGRDDHYATSPGQAKWTRYALVGSDTYKWRDLPLAFVENKIKMERLDPALF